MTIQNSELAERIEEFFGQGVEGDREAARSTFVLLRERLSSGHVRAAEPDLTSPTGWRVNTWVKQGILLGFRWGNVVRMALGPECSSFLDKDILPLKHLEPSDGVRVVPGGSSIRDGAYVGHGVICMPPMYINIGAYVDDDSLIDSHALIGSCAQIGRRVHISAGAQIGGVLEPVGALPVIIEDEVLVGGNTGIYEGAVIKTRAVIAAGTILTGSTPVFDLPKDRVLKSHAGTHTIIPEGAVVVPGARAITSHPGKKWGLSLTTPVIVKYRDDRTDTRTELEKWLR